MAEPEERDLVPYEASRFTARRALALAAHADDEVFGCGAAIALLARDGAEVDVAVFTDGAWDEPDPEVRERISAARLEESRAALALLGGARLHAVGLPDRKLGERRRDAARAIASLLSDLRPDLVLVPSPVEIHPDHRALSEAFLSVVKQRGSALTGIAAFYELSQPIRPNFLLDATEVVAAKDKAMEAFASQNAARDYPAYIRGLNAYRRMTLPASVAAAEAFYVAPFAELARRSALELARAVGPAVPRAREKRGVMASLLGGLLSEGGLR